MAGVSPAQSGEQYIDVNCRNSEAMTPLLLVTRDTELFEKGVSITGCHPSLLSPSNMLSFTPSPLPPSPQHHADPIQPGGSHEGATGETCVSCPHGYNCHMTTM